MHNGITALLEASPIADGIQVTGSTRPEAHVGAICEATTF